MKSTHSRRLARQGAARKRGPMLQWAVERRDVSGLFVPRDKDVERWLRAALRPWVGRAFVSVLFCGEAEAQELNARWRGKDNATNVLSFAYDEPDNDPDGQDAGGSAEAGGLDDSDRLGGSGALAWGARGVLRGDLALCPAVVEREASQQGIPARHHFAHLIVHGALHLQGYDHIDDDEAREMEALEASILSLFSIPDPYLCEHPRIQDTKSVPSHG